MNSSVDAMKRYPESQPGPAFSPRGEPIPDERIDTTIYQVVINEEEQYSIWPAYRDLPAGWKAVGKQGTKNECLAYIQEVWTDMRPKSLRDKMKQQGQP